MKSKAFLQRTYKLHICTLCVRTLITNELDETGSSHYHEGTSDDELDLVRYGVMMKYIVLNGGCVQLAWQKALN
jgi:hypothetical protein